MKSEVTIRTATSDDIPFIYSTWLNSYHNDSCFANTRKSIFMEQYREVIDNLLLKSKAIVACKTDDPSVIYSYLIYKNNTLHYTFTKEAFRKLGIAKELYKHAFQQNKDKTYHTDVNLLDQIGPVQGGVSLANSKHDISDNRVIITHRTTYVNQIIQQNPQFTYNPFLLYIKGDT